MRNVLRSVLAALAAVGIAVLVPAAGAWAAPADAVVKRDPSPVAGAVTKAGTSFLGAAAVNAGQEVNVGAATGEYLYWSFTAEAGQIYDVAATVTLPPAGDRHGSQSWVIELFDGLRRRQACVAGGQSAVAATGDARVSLRCVLRQVRSWAEPWSGDPLPGTFYLRLSANDIPERDLGQPAKVDLLLGMNEGSVTADDGELAAPLNPVAKAGTVSESTTDPAAAGTDPEADEDEDDSILPDLPSLSARWFWTAGGGVLGAVAAVFGFAVTRRRSSAG